MSCVVTRGSWQAPGSSNFGARGRDPAPCRPARSRRSTSVFSWLDFEDICVGQCLYGAFYNFFFKLGVLMI